MNGEDGIFNQVGQGPTERDLPKLRTFVVRQYRGVDDKGAPQSFEIALGAHSLQPDTGDLFFTTYRLENGSIQANISRAFARGTWSEVEEFLPTGLIS